MLDLASAGLIVTRGILLHLEQPPLIHHLVCKMSLHLLLVLLLPIATYAKGHLSTEAFINGISGFYEIDPKLLFGNWQHIKWYTVEIKWNQAKGAFTWQNREAVTWTLTPLMGDGGSWDETKLLVGNECPYRYEGHEFAKIEWVSFTLFSISSVPD